MLGSAVIDVIIGLVFVYILLSLLVAQVNQIIANALNIRARQLRTRVEALLFDPDIQERVLAHPIIGLIRPSQVPNETRNQRTLPVTRLAASNFSKALLNILSDPYLDFYAALSNVENKDEYERLQAVLNQVRANIADPARANAALNKLHQEISQLEPPERKDRRALLRTLGPLQDTIRDLQSGNAGLLQILNGVSRVENRNFQQAMETVLATVQNVNEAEQAIQEWYDNKMAQTKDLYGRTMQYLSLLVGLLIAIFLNIDSLYLARTLWVDSSLREQVTLAANAALINPNFAITPGQTTVQPTTDENGSDTVEQIVENFEEANAILGDLLELNLPIGWAFRPPFAGVTEDIEGISGEEDIEFTEGEDPAEGGRETLVTFYNPLEDSRNLYNLIPFVAPNWFWNITIKVAGLLVTAFAVAQGAPFWFDVLRRISGNNRQNENETANATTNT
jgi:hypothetical protein